MCDEILQRRLLCTARLRAQRVRSSQAASRSAVVLLSSPLVLLLVEAAACCVLKSTVASRLTVCLCSQMDAFDALAHSLSSLRPASSPLLLLLGDLYLSSSFRISDLYGGFQKFIYEGKQRQNAM